MAEQEEQHFHQKLFVFLRKPATVVAMPRRNFVFMTMVCFQASFYTDVFGISAATAGTIILVARLWDAFFDPIMVFWLIAPTRVLGQVPPVGTFGLRFLGRGHGSR